MKRFYKVAGTAATEGGFQVTLDSRPVRTPSKSPLSVPTGALAKALADEWDAQADEVVPAAMPLNQLANSAIDLMGQNRVNIEATMVGFIDADLICYRAEGPTELVAAQARHWQPIVDWFAAEFGAPLTVTDGIAHVAQDKAAGRAVAAALANKSDFQLTALHEMATILQSISLALAMDRKRLSSEQAWRASRVDEEHQISRWGADAEAGARAQKLRQELETANQFRILLDDCRT